jgi:hypothetical protein
MDMTDTIKNTINKFPLGFIFTTSDFPAAAENPKQVNKILNKLVAEGFIRRLFKEIPDTMPDAACRRLLALFRRLSPEQITTVKRLALKYNPATIALLGAMLEMLNSKENTVVLFKKLNPITIYKLNISLETLPTQRKWHIQR